MSTGSPARRVPLLLAVILTARLVFVPALGASLRGREDPLPEVTPDGADATVSPYSEGNVATFKVKNTRPDFGEWYWLECSIGIKVVACEVPYRWLFLGPGDSAYVDVTYSAGEMGVGYVALTAVGEIDGTDGWYAVAVGDPAVVWAPQNRSTNNGFNVDRSRCVSTRAGGPTAFQCGDLVAVHAFPGYRSLNESRSFSLVYNSSTADPRPVFLADLPLREGESVPERIVVEVDLERDGGIDKTVYFDGPASVTKVEAFRIAVPVAPSPGGTRVVPYRVTTTYEYPKDPPTEYIVDGMFLEVDRQSAPYGAGWGVLGVPRLYPQSDGSVLLVDGDGSVQRFTPTAGKSFDPPPGEYSELEEDGTYVWRSQGQLVVAEFDASGLLSEVYDRAGNTARYFWTIRNGEPALDSIVDAAGKVVRLGYSGDKLSSVTVPGYAAFQVRIPAATLDTISDPDGIKTVMEYSSNRLTSWRGRALGIWRYTYDELGRPDSVYWPNYDPIDLHSHVLEGAPLAGTGTPANPAELGWPDSAYIGYTDGNGNRTRFWVDRFGAVVRILDAKGLETLVQRDTLSFPEKITWPSGRVVKEEWNTADGTLSEVVEVGRGNATTMYEYHPSFKLVTEIIPPTGWSRAVSFGYDPTTARRVWIANAMADTVRFDYNARGLVSRIREPLDTVSVEFRYNSAWNLSHVIEPHPGGGTDTTLISYDATGTRISSVQDPLGNIKSVYWDAVGRDTAFVQSGGALMARTRFVYNDVARKRLRYDPEGRRTSWEYNPAGDLVKRCVGPTDELCATLWYDPAGNLERFINRNGQSIVYQYDELRRLRLKRVPQQCPDFGPCPGGFYGDSVTFDYDVDGRLLSARNYYADVEYRYNEDGTLKQEWTCIRKWSSGGYGQCRNYYYRYDVDGLRRALSYSIAFSDSIYWQRNARGISAIGNTYHRPNGVKLLFSIEHDGNGRLTRVDANVPSWYDERFYYNDRDLLVRHTVGVRTVDSLLYNGAGQVTYAQSLGDGFNNYEYDGLGRLDSTWWGYTRTEEFTYDRSGNRTRWHRAGEMTDLMGYVYDAFGQLDTVHDSLDHCDIDYYYDNDGRRTRSYSWCENDGRPEDVYRYTAEGRMVQHKMTHDAPGGRRSERRVYWYDALGRRILLYSPDSTYTGAPVNDNGVWRFYYSGSDLVARSKSDVQCPDYELLNPYTEGTWFTPGLGPNEILAAWHKGSPAYTHQFHIRDHRTSVVEVRNEDDQYLTGAAYSSFGLVANGDPPQEAGFAGGMAAGGLVQFHHRYYDGVVGQFTSEDPIGFAGGSNLYAYAANNPVTYTDPFGLCPVCLRALAQGFARLTGPTWDPDTNERIEKLHPDVQAAARLFINLADLGGVRLRVTEGYRGLEEQNAAYQAGASNAMFGQSYHNYGLAIDVVEMVNGLPNWDADWDAIGALGKGLGFEWSGEWTSFAEEGHFQMRFGQHWSELYPKTFIFPMLPVFYAR
ncbi:MAG: hypothetical protein AMS25_11480 [Gemmatimonas sp. SM23_52]|nr:MAG: hypothetical protein AMS25_11480 [Gemmatimonas sp. SM23_52]